MEINNEYFTLEEKNNILYVTMNAPGNNLMTGDFLLEFVKMMDEVKFITDSKKLKGIIISGSGRHFSVGADVQSLVGRSSYELEEIENTKNFPDDFKAQKNAVTMANKIQIPVISAVRGFCIGSGSEIAINSHIRIVEPTARIGQPESTFGILPALGGIGRTAQICGLAEAIEIVMTGDLFNAQTAYEKGWADILCEKKQSVVIAEKLIEFINSCGIEYSPEQAQKFVSMFLESGGLNE